MNAAKHKLREAIDSLYTHGRATSEAYTRLVLNCVRHNDIHQAKRLQSHMDLHFYEPTSTFLHNRLLQLFTKYGQLSDACKLFDRMPNRDIFTYNAMLSGYSKLGPVEDLLAFFDRMPCRDSVSYNTVIAGLGSHGCSREALEVFARMRREGFESTDYTLVSVLNACSQILDLKCGKEIHGRIVVCNLGGGNAFVWNALVDMYAKCGKIDEAQCLFDRMVNKSVVSWNLMISGYLKHGQPEKCVELFHEMQFAGSKPDQVTVSNVLGAFFKMGKIEGARKTFLEIKEKDKVCWTTMIVGYVQNYMEENALILFRQMLLENIRPDNFTISSVVSACARLASVYHGQIIHGKAFHIGVDTDLLVSSALVDMYSKCGEIKDAWTIFTTMPMKNVISWNSMIIGYAHNGKDIEALALYEEMLQENMKPDNVTFVGVLSACIHAGFTEQGWRYFDSMGSYGMTPTLDHYACMINLLGRSGSTDKAVDLIEGMPYFPNSLIWSTLLSICKVSGDIENGEIAARHLFELDPLNAEPYIMLSNMYAAKGRWNDVASMRSLMKSKNVKKFAAYSRIEIDGKMYKFVSEDRTHPESEAIYRKLNRLICKLQEDGFVPNKNLVLRDVGEDEKFESICYHSEKLALAYGLIRKPQGRQPIRILKNIRVCGDCHVFMKFVSKIIDRPIILRDSNRFHHFVGGQCSCKELW